MPHTNRASRVMVVRLAPVNVRDVQLDDRAFAKVATAVIAGLGAEGYRAATASLVRLIK